VNETTKDNESKGKWERTTREEEYHVPVRTWARKWDRMEERMRERENDNVNERKVWRSSVHKS